VIAEPPIEALNVAEYTVSELAALNARSRSPGYIRVRGEISGFKKHSSGHCYFALKDDAVS
jgi:exodeoxyribonuclease VII large subunit